MTVQRWILTALAGLALVGLVGCSAREQCDGTWIPDKVVTSNGGHSDPDNDGVCSHDQQKIDKENNNHPTSAPGVGGTR